MKLCLLKLAYKCLLCYTSMGKMFYPGSKNGEYKKTGVEKHDV